MSAVAAASPSAAIRSTPVTIVTGFLGAGKTTLLNKVLKQFVEDKNIAVIENEFGEVNLDSKMVSNNLRSKEDLVSMHNGCVCCSLRKDILSALGELSRRSEQAGRPYDNIILETTGLADPAPVAFTFFSNSWAKKRFHLDSIVTVVDAKYLHRHLATGASVAEIKSTHGEVGNATTEGKEAAASASPGGTSGHSGHSPVNEVFNQIAFADIVLLNKVDLVSDDAALAVERAIREINSLAKILDSKNFSLQRALEVDQNFLDAATSSEDEDAPPDALTSHHDHDHAHTSDHAAPSTSHGRTEKRSAVEMEEPVQVSSGHVAEKVRRPRKLLRTLHDLTSVRSVYVLLPGELDTYLFNMFMNDFLQERGTDIFRSKGTLCVHGHQRTFNFQGVHETFQLAPCCNEGFDIQSNPHSEIVFIGRRLDKAAIKQGLLACLWRPLPPSWVEYLDKKTCRAYYVNTETGAKSWTRPVHTTPEGINEDNAAAAAAVAAGEERTYISESCVKQPPSVRPGQA